VSYFFILHICTLLIILDFKVGDVIVLGIVVASLVSIELVLSIVSLVISGVLEF
jgi:hypothetical protein